MKAKSDELSSAQRSAQGGAASVGMAMPSNPSALGMRPPPEPKPSSEPAPHLGSIVHYLAEDSTTPYAAIVTGVHPDNFVDLFVFHPGQGLGYLTSVPQRTGDSGSGWFWPPHV